MNGNNINNNINNEEETIDSEAVTQLDGGRLIKLPLVGEIKESFLNYAMSVIVDRALPDIRDGLKPVQRRVLFAMSELGLKHNTGYKKSARIVGETMGKYHPHGDSSIYETMVRLAQDWNLRYKLVDGQGNFGSIDGDSPAAMRYTEARLHRLGELMLEDLDEDTVDWGPNFDESLKEPLSLPSILPNLLVNGSTGIAVGMATNMPPHNLSEVVNVLCWLLSEHLDPEQASLSDIIKFLPGPDFPTGGLILGRAGIIEAYKTGRGKIIIRGKMHIEEGKRGRSSIIITEIPYAVNKSLLIASMVEAVNNKEIDGVSELRDESDRDGMRIVLDLTRDADPDLIMRQLYKKTALQSTFGVINIALVDKRPQILPLAKILKAFLDYRREIVRRRTSFRLRQASAREHIVEGLIKALDDIDNIINFIRAAKTAQEARDNLVKNNFTDLQAQAILDMRLQRLTGLERDKLSSEKSDLLLSIANFNNILNNADVLDQVIHDELKELGAKFGDERRTEIIDSYEEIADDDMIPNVDIVVTLSRDGFLKRQDLAGYALQGRGGKGRKGASVQAEDAIAALCVTNTLNDLFFFTNKGRVMTLRGHVIPETRTGKGKQISRLLPLEEGENVVTLASGVSSGWEYAFFITKNAVAKRVTVKDLTENNRPKRVIMLDPGDEIAQICLTSGEDDLLLVTQEAKALRVSEKEFRPLSRTARGVTAMKLGMNDRILSCSVVKPDEQVLFLSERGLGKRTRFDEFTAHHRATSGVTAMNISQKTGRLICSNSVKETDEIVAITQRGRMIRIAVKETPSSGRITMGNILVRPGEDDSIVGYSVVRVDESETEPESEVKEPKSDDATLSLNL